MGSFNETCALSNLNIGCGTKVRVLFLTQNPYNVTKRSCYPTDQWFVRTPPIKGVYDDYGKCKFKKNEITDLICEVFKDDVVEMPFGFNQYHEPDVTKTKGIHHFLNAAWEGRLFVQDNYFSRRKEPENFPTWQKVQEIIRGQKLPIQSDSKKSEGRAGYNAQDLIPGVVCVTFNSYDNNQEKLEKIIPLFDQIYDCKIINGLNHSKSDCCLMVVPKGAYENVSILMNEESVRSVINNSYTLADTKRLPVLTVMIREDVWQAYCNVPAENELWNDRPSTVTAFYNKLKEICVEYVAAKKTWQKFLFHLFKTRFAEFLFDLPFMTTPKNHIMKALDAADFPATDELLQDCAELARIEYVMARANQPWYIPPTGGQDGEWELKTALLSSVLEISKKELKKYDNYNEEE